LRLLGVLANALPIDGPPAHYLEPRLSALAVLFVAVGVFAGLRLANRRGDGGDLAPAGLAGGSLGLLASALCFALLQGVEQVLGPWSASLWAVVLFWGTLGALLALVSLVVIPHRLNEPEVRR
jgi:hypothetical protein